MLGFSGRPRWNPAGRHAYVVGGSQGLGLAFAIMLAQRGADVSIVARDQVKLDAALQSLEGARANDKQVFKVFSYSVDTYVGAKAAYDAVCAGHGDQTPDDVFLCAGAHYPCFWVEASEEMIRRNMDVTYWVHAWTAKVTSERMVREHRTGKIVFVASLVAYFSFTGYSTYSPGKFAVRGLAETLRQEFLLYGIDVHLYLPGTFNSPGYELENKKKPDIVLKIEKDDTIMTPEQCAQGLFKGLTRGDFHITDTFNGHAFRTNTRGATPWNSFAKDLFFGFAGMIAIPLWRRGVDKMIVQHKKEHEEHLRSQGFFGSTS